MECFIVTPEDVDTSRRELSLQGDEARHAARSLRMRVGESFIATDLQGCCYLATIMNIDEIGKHELIVRSAIDDVLPEHNEPTVSVELIQGILNQPSKFEEIIERCTEIGISVFTPIVSERVERNNLKRERLEKLLRTACKQAHRARMPLLQPVRSFDEALEAASSARKTLILLHEGADLSKSLRIASDANSGNGIALVIGPEGGFSDTEVELAQSKYSAFVASLGPRRLRAETAAFTASAIALV
jgi:16S rRNA (uracil1498-N3)-methyltransferase